MLRAALSLASILLIAVAARPADGFMYGNSLEAAFKTAKDDKKLVFLLLTDDSKESGLLETELPQIAKFSKVMNKHFVPVKMIFKDVPRDLMKESRTRSTASVYILSADKEFIGSNVHPYPPVAKVVNWIEDIVELKAGLEALESAEKTKPGTIVAAFKKIGKAQSFKGAKIFTEYAENKDYADDIRKAAIEQLIRQREGAEKILPLLDDANAVVRRTAASSLKSAGTKAVPALLKGLEAETPDQRVACAAILKPIVGDNKLSRDANFWKVAREAERNLAIAGLKQWWKLNAPPNYSADLSN